MLLAIDSGNTNTVFAVFDSEGVIKGEWRSAVDSQKTADDYGVWLLQLFQRAGISMDAIDSTIIASVVPDKLFDLKSLCQRYFNQTPLIVGEPGVDLGIKSLIDRPEETGADRLVNAVAVGEAYPGAMIVIDFGTATTFDVVDANGNYCGGSIAPGINLSIEALHMAAAKLPTVAIRHPDKVIGTSTVSAMQSGIFWGYVGLIEGMIRRIREEFGQPMGVIATGGLATLFAEAVDSIDAADGDLTLRGLWIIHRRNRS